MCGILWIESKKQRTAVKPLLKRYRSQEGRGTDGFGYLTVSLDGYISEVHRATDEKGIIELLNNENASFILLHHRQPTSLPNYLGATHPLVVKDDRFEYDYYIVHNGVIRNYKTMWEDYEKQGFKFLTKLKESKVHEFVNSGEWYGFDEEFNINDSEAFAVDIANYIEGKQNIVRSSGTIAFIALQCTKDGKVVNIIWGRNDGNPLKVEADKALFCLKSEGHGQVVKPETLFFKNWETGEITERKAVGLIWGGYSGKQSSLGFREGPLDVPARSDERTGGSREKTGDLEETLRKMLPAGSLKEIDSHRREIVDSRETQFRDFEDDEERTDVATVDMAGLGFPETALDDEIAAADATGDDSAGVIRELRDCLKLEIESENDAIAEFNAAKSLLKEAARKYQGKRSNLDQLEEARGLVSVATENLSRCRKARQATAAELSAYVGTGFERDE